MDGQFAPGQANQFVGARPRFIPYAVNFDGTNDYLTRGAALTGAADSKLFTFSAWVRTSSDSGLVRTIFSGTASGAVRFQAQVMDLNRLRFFCRNAAGTTILNVSSTTNSIETADGWVHLLASFNLGTGGKHIYVDDVSDYAIETTFINDTIDFTVTNFGIGGVFDGTAKLPGNIAEFWFEDGLYIDFSAEANRRKFISAGKQPVFLGATGQLPNGTAPLIYLGGPETGWHTNKGSGGGFTENGALDVASPPP